MIQRPQVIALASATSTNGTARNGANLATEFAVPGTIAVVCSASITTSSVLATFKLQLSYDSGTTGSVGFGSVVLAVVDVAVVSTMPAVLAAVLSVVVGSPASVEGVLVAAVVSVIFGLSVLS